jgi:hypothetical protein
MGTAATLRVMAQLVTETIAQSQTRECALQVVGTVNAANQADAIMGIREFVRSHMRLVADPGELLVRPDRMLYDIYTRGWTAGDCDDAAMLVASLLGSIGFNVRFRAIGPRGDGSYAHVFCEVLRPANPPKWVPIDTTVTYTHGGWFRGAQLRTNKGPKTGYESMIQVIN